MTEKSRVWDGVLTGDATEAPYSASEWAYREAQLHGLGLSFPNYGILQGSGGGTYEPLAVKAKSPVSANIEIEIGAALATGYLYETTAAVTLTVAANASGNARIDTVILRVDFVAQTVRAVIKQGTPAASPARPSLQQDATYWEIPLADIAVANGFATIAQTVITDRRRAVHSLPQSWLPYAYPLSHVINGNYDAANRAIPANSGAIAVPIMLNGNMLLHDIVFRAASTNTYSLNWGFYFQDVNDQNTAENTVRLVASGSVTGFATTATSNATITASPSAQYLAPGLYWFVLLNQTAAVLNIGTIAASALDLTPILTKTTGLGSLPQTLDLVTGWATSTDKMGMYFRGRVFGKTTVL